MAAGELARRETWVRAGGRCVICNEWLMEDHLSDPGAVRPIGEVAHIIGESQDGPRGGADAETDRNASDNLMLLCPNEHTAADKRLADSLYTVDYLTRAKAKHEAFVKFVTGLRDAGTTTVFRVHGDVRGRPTMATRAQAAAAVMHGRNRTPQYLPDPKGQGVEVSLLSLPDAQSSDYWPAAARSIEFGVDRVRTAIADGDIDDLSVFAIAYLPLLVHLGACLDNTVPVEVFQRHHATDQWTWSDDGPTHTFHVDYPETAAAHDDAVLVINVSGTIGPGEIPADLVGRDVFTISPDDAQPAPDLVSHRETLANFEQTLRAFYASLEQAKFKSIRTLHLLAAVPVSAAVTIGRLLPADNAAPELVVYHRTQNRYMPALRVPWQPTTNGAD